MLEKMKEKVTQKLPVEILQSDMTSFALPESVDRIFCRDAFFHNLTPQDQNLTLSCVHRSLNPNGIFAFNIHVPNPHFLVFASSEEGRQFKERGRYNIPGTEDTLSISQSLEADLNLQIITTNLKYEIFGRQNNKVSEEYSSWKARYTYPYEMFYLLEIQGFRIRNAFGNYDREPWNINSILIIEAVKIS